MFSLTFQTLFTHFLFPLLSSRYRYRIRIFWNYYYFFFLYVTFLIDFCSVVGADESFSNICSADLISVLASPHLAVLSLSQAGHAMSYWTMRVRISLGQFIVAEPVSGRTRTLDRVPAPEV